MCLSVCHAVVCDDDDDDDDRSPPKGAYIDNGRICLCLPSATHIIPPEHRTTCGCGGPLHFKAFTHIRALCLSQAHSLAHIMDDPRTDTHTHFLFQSECGFNGRYLSGLKCGIGHAEVRERMCGKPRNHDRRLVTKGRKGQRMSDVGVVCSLMM